MEPHFLSSLQEVSVDLDERIAIAKQLIAKREEVDCPLTDLLGGALPTSKLTRVCSNCGQSGHTAGMCAGAEQSAAARKPT